MFLWCDKSRTRNNVCSYGVISLGQGIVYVLSMTRNSACFYGVISQGQGIVYGRVGYYQNFCITIFHDTADLTVIRIAIYCGYFG